MHFPDLSYASAGFDEPNDSKGETEIAMDIITRK
jgi:hypothetical protein